MSQVYFLVSNTEVLKYNTLQLQDIIDSVLQELEATTPRSKSSLSVLESMQQQGYRPITPHEYITIIRSQGENAQVPFWIPKENNSTSPSELPTDKSSLNDNYIESMDGYFLGDSDDLLLRGPTDSVPTSFTIASTAADMTSGWLTAEEAALPADGN